MFEEGRVDDQVMAVCIYSGDLVDVPAGEFL
jgi:hypothetical protein